MNKIPRILRIIAATIVFVCITCGFLNISGGNPLSQAMLRTQFTPALVSIFSGSAAAFIILIVVTILFGRVYCSFLCPLGIFQDIIIRVSDIARKRANGGRVPKKKYRKPHNTLRYSILAVTGFITLALGSAYPLALLDPYSNYGKICTQIFSSVEIAITNGLSGIFPSMFYTQEYARLSLQSFIFALVFLFIIVLFSAFRGRLYCNSICPVGSFLGVLSGISLFKPQIEKDKCVKCNLCAGNCKSNCIDLETKEIDITRCIACYNCLVSCKRGGVKLVPTWFTGKKKKNDDKEHDSIENKGRRNALIAMGGFAAAAVAGKYLSGRGKSGGTLLDEDSQGCIMPAGAGNLNSFKNSCTACYACIAACPEQIIKPAAFEYGIDGIMLPVLKYDNGYCRYDCNKCSQTCPNGALTHIALEVKQKTSIAVAQYDASSCVIVTDGVRCGACRRNCPAGAIEMKENPAVPGQFLPSIDAAKCIGCGACKDVCPGMPKAIEIKGKRVQTMAI